MPLLQTIIEKPRVHLLVDDSFLVEFPPIFLVRLLPLASRARFSNSNFGYTLRRISSAGRTLRSNNNHGILEPSAGPSFSSSSSEKSRIVEESLRASSMSSVAYHSSTSIGDNGIVPPYLPPAVPPWQHNLSRSLPRPSGTSSLLHSWSSK